jgi:large subunit ribosomal protein L17
MRHRKKTVKLQRNTAHRESMLKNLVLSLVEHRRIRTTVAKAKALRPIAEKMVTLGKKANAATAAGDTAGYVHYRRLAAARLHQNQRLIKMLFEVIAVKSATRPGGYTRITKLGQRRTDSAPMAYIEWMDAFEGVTVETEGDEPAAETATETEAAATAAA